MKKEKFDLLLTAIFCMIGIVLYVFIMSLCLKTLWNHVIPEIFGLSTLKYNQALCIFVLSNLLFSKNYNIKDKK